MQLKMFPASSVPQVRRRVVPTAGLITDLLSTVAPNPELAPLAPHVPQSLARTGRAAHINVLTKRPSVLSAWLLSLQRSKMRLGVDLKYFGDLCQCWQNPPSGQTHDPEP